MYPKAYLAFTCVEEMEPAIHLCDDIDAIFLQKRLRANENHVGHTRIVDTSVLAETIIEVREKSFDYYIDFQGTFQSALFGLLANIPTRLGPNIGKDGAYLYYNLLYEGKWREINRMQRHLNVAKVLFPQLEAEVASDKPKECHSESRIIIAPGTSDIGKYKRWPATYFAKLIYFIRERYIAQIQIVCSEDEQKIGKEILSLVGNERCSLTICTNFEDAKHVIMCADAFIGGDSAYTHIATVSNIPSFMIIGPTSPSENIPWTNVISGFSYLNSKCSPCDLWSQKCPNQIYCMKMLLPNIVEKDVERFLAKVFISNK